MGVLRAGFNGTVGQPSAQVIDGSLKFDGSYLKRTPGSAGNRKIFTWSGWVKLNELASFYLFSVPDSSGHASFMFDSGQLRWNTYSTSTNGLFTSNAYFRDTGWYHVVFAFDATESTTTDRIKVYVNGERLTSSSYTTPDGSDTPVNNTVEHSIGARYQDTTSGDVNITNNYLIDGQALGPENFGFTDPLTNTWKPKKYEGTFGTNGFYLPMDGNSPIGIDKSGQGNNWTPKNFGGSNSLEKATGARPILNTTQGASQAGVGVFGSRQNVGYAVTVYDDGGGNKYYIDGVKQATLNGLIRGATYTFDTSDSTLGSTHPFRLSATSAHGTEYTNGVAAITGAATTITIPYNAPESLYYYCTSHSGMGSSITGITTNEKLADQYASNVTLALPLVGNDDDVCASIACTANNKTPTNSSVTAATTQSNFYSGSHYWNANTDSLLYAQQGNELVFGTNDFTIEFWFYDDNGHNGNNNRCVLFDNRRGGNVQGDPPQLVGYVDSHNEINLYYANGSEINITVPSTVGKWWHYAAVRSSGTTKLYIDGVEVGSASDTTNYPNNGIALGSGTDSGYSWSGYIQDFRVYTGVAKYTSNFVPAATSPDILPDTPSGVSGSSKLAKITDGAVSFDGTNDTLSVPDHADFTFGSGDFTLEAFVYNRSSGYRSLVMKYGGSPSTSSWFWSMYNGQNQFYYYSGGNEPVVTSGKTHYNKWVHCAVSREGNTIRIFDDGELTGTLDVSSYATMNDSTVPIDIGADYANNYDMDGFISNVRIVKGTALYTKSFTAPSAPLTNVTNTKLLCCQSNASAGAAAVSPQISGLNSGTVWSDYLTTTQGANSRDFYTVASNPASNLFDGDTSTIVYGGWTDDADDNSDLIFSPPSGISVSSKLEVYVGYYSKIKVNGADYNTGGQSTAQAWVTVSDGSNFTGTLTELILENTSNANVVRAAAIRIDDSTILLDPVLQQGNAVATTFNPFITDINTVRGQETGYPTWNPLRVSGQTLSNSNMTTTGASGNVLGSMFTPTSGKFYWEVTAGSDYTMTGIQRENNYDMSYPGNSTGQIAMYLNTGVGSGQLYQGGSATSSWGGGVTGDIIGVALDMDNNKVYFYNNGRGLGTGGFTGTPEAVTVPTGGGYTANCRSGSGAYDGPSTINFGQKPFKFPPPDGYQSLNDANIRPETVISRPDQYVGITTWKGDDQASHVINDLNFDGIPDFVWIKRRDGNSVSHQLYDTIRGATKPLNSNATSSEDTQTSGLKAFVRNGFELGASSMVNGLDGDNANVPFNYVAWCWKAGGSKNTFNVDNVGYASAAAAGLDGGLTVTGASVGTKQGFSIIKATGSNSQNSFKHGLGKVPKFVISKDMDNSRAWYIYHGSLGANYRGSFDNAAFSSDSGYFGSGMTDTLVTLKSGGSGGNNYNGADMIYYVWADVPGLQKFGKYLGNGNADGVFVELGFRPALLWIKNTDAQGNWVIVDTQRDKHNPVKLKLYADYSGQENVSNPAGDGASYNNLDILSNGFKMRSNNTWTNTTQNYIYCAWAEAPTIDLYGGGANAR